MLGRKLELLSRDSKANADEAVRLARELIIKDNVDFLVGHADLGRGAGGLDDRQGEQDRLRRAAAKTMQLTAPKNLHPYIFRLASNTDDRGPHRRGARWRSGRT